MTALSATSAPPSFLETRRGKLTLALVVTVAFIDLLDASIVKYRSAADLKASARHRTEPAVGRERLSAHLWRVPAARRSRG